MASTYELLIEKLDQFIRKYYVNKLIRGSLYSIGVIILCFLAFALAEHFFYFGRGIRKGLLLGFVGVSAISLAQWIVGPLLRYFRLGRVISHEQAADIIGEHFEDVKDKLLNVLQLKRQSEHSAHSDLVLASVQKKTAEISPVPFQRAIDLRKNRRYLPYALPPLLILLGILVGAPSLIKDPTHRILKNNLDFERAAPFHFQLTNTELSVPQFDDFPLDVKIVGEALPDQAFIEINGFQYRMKKVASDHFSYTFNNVQEDQQFNLIAAGVRSHDFELDVLRKPNILDLVTELDYPAYTGRRDEILQNMGDLVVPQGTKIDWILEALHTEDLAFTLGDEAPATADRIAENQFYLQFEDFSQYALSDQDQQQRASAR